MHFFMIGIEIVLLLVIVVLLSDMVRVRGRFGYKVKTKQKGGNIMLDVYVTNEEKILVSVSPKTHAGQAALLDGPVTVSAQSGDGTVTMVDDNSFYLNSGALPGDTAFLVSGDADLGAGVENISEVIILHVSGAKAANLGIAVGPPELK